MTIQRTTTGFLLLVVLAFGGLALTAVPPWIAGQIETVSKAGRIWLIVYLSVVGSGAALLAFSTVSIVWRLWGRSLRKKNRRRVRSRSPSQLSRAEQEQELSENLAAIDDLQNELPAADLLRQELEPAAEKLAEKQSNKTLEIVAFGSISSGKSSLLNALAGRELFSTDPRGGTTLQRNEVPWPGKDQVILVDTPGLGEVAGAERGRVSTDAAKDADLVLVVVDGPLRDWEFQLLKNLGEMEKRVLICLNKEDWYDQRERERLVGQIKDQVAGIARPEDVVAVHAQTTHRTRVRVAPDGSTHEEQIPQPPDIHPLANRMLQIVRRDGRDLLLANLLLQSRGLVDEAKQRVQTSLDQRAWGIVERYMWGAGGAAALSPFPILDLAAGCAISTKMVVDLARVYHQDVDLQTAVNLVAQLGKNLLAILGVSVATPAVTAAVASLLKTVPGVGTIAGGLLQGIVQALVTRWIGAVFIQYFKAEMQASSEALASIARREWERLTTIDQLQQLVRTARNQLSDENTST
jgi:small GTP-binding protein